MQGAGPGDLTGPGSAVVFDLDDTLVFTREVKWAHHKQVAREHYGIELTDEVLAAHWGEPFDQMIGHLYQHSASVEEMRAANRASAHLFPKIPIPGAVETVDQLVAAGTLVAVLTSTNTALALADLARCGFRPERLAFVQGADLTEHHKPDPRVFEPALDQLAQAGAERVTYVGDALIDARAAEDAGIGFVAVCTGLFGPEAFEGHRVVPTVAELLQAL